MRQVISKRTLLQVLSRLDQFNCLRPSLLVTITRLILEMTATLLPEAVSQVVQFQLGRSEPGSSKPYKKFPMKNLLGLLCCKMMTLSVLCII